MPGDAMGCVPGQNCVYVCLAPDEQQEPIFSLARQLVAEAVGSALLVATIVGSGLQAVQLSTDDGVALLGNTVATLGILYVLITVFGKVSGAHFNPLVSLAFCLRREMEPSVCAGFVVVQCLAGLHRGLHHRQRHVRAGRRLLRWQRPREAGDGRGRGSRRVWATAHHIWLLEDGTEKRDIPLAVALCVTAGYWYTSSTSFANPAVTLGRCFTDTFASINPSSYGHFVGGLLAGFAVAMPFVSWMFDGADVVDALGVLLRRPTAASVSAPVARAVSSSAAYRSSRPMPTELWPVPKRRCAPQMLAALARAARGETRRRCDTEPSTAV